MKEEDNISLKEYIKEHFVGINKRLDKLVDISEKQEENMEKHMSRTAQLEGRQEHVESVLIDIASDQKDMKDELKPISKHVALVQFLSKWGFKIVGGSSILTGVGYIIKNVLGL